MSIWQRAVYRVKQFAWALRAETLPWQPPDLSDYLNGEQLAGFQRMPRTDQHHGITVWQKLRQQGLTDRDLLQAALLHDMAKADQRLTLFHRATIILLKALLPSAIERMAVDQPDSWRYPFYINLYHPEIGADMAQKLGLSERAAALIRYHHAEPTQVPRLELRPLLEWLRQADDSS